MAFKIDNTPPPKPAPLPYQTGDLLTYTPNGNVYVLGKQKSRNNEPPMFDYIVYNPSQNTVSAGRDGSFSSRHFTRFEGSITLSN